MDKSSGWIKKHPDEIVSTLGSDKNQGLREKSVHDIRGKLGKNNLWYTGHPLMFLRHESGFSIVGYIVVIISALSAAAFNKCEDSSFVVLSLLIGAALSLFFYVYSGFLCKFHSSKWIPKCTVIRDGKIIKIRGDLVVPGDIVLLSKGDFICADMKLIETDEFFINDVSTGNNSSVQRSAITGALTIDGKTAIRDHIFAGSRVISGRAKAVVCAVGNETLIGKRSKIKLVPEREPTTIASTRKLGFTTGTFAMIFAFAAVAIGVFSPISSSDFIELFLVFVAFAVSSGGELLPALSCLMFALSFKNCKLSGVIVRDFTALELLRAPDGIAVENSNMMKTGEITLKSVWTSGNTVEIGNADGDELFSVLLAGTEYGKGKYGIEVASAVEINFENRGDPERFINGTKTTKTVLEHKKVGTAQYSLYASGGEHYFSVTGAIDEVLSYCTKIEINGVSIPIDKNNLSSLLSAASEASKVATVLIAVAVRKSPYNSMKRLSVLASDLTFIGFIAVDTPADPELVSHLSYLKRENIPFFFFSDGSGEDINFARKCGVIRDRKEMVAANDPDLAVNVLLSEQSYGGVVSVSDDSEIYNVLKIAKKSGKQLIFAGDPDISKGYGLSVSVDNPVLGSGGYIIGEKKSKTTCLLEAVRTIRATFKRFNTVKKYLAISAVLRAVYAITAVFGMPFVFPSVVLVWGLVIDVAVSVAILSAKRKKQEF